MFVVTSAPCVHAANAQEMRTWTDVTGKFRKEAVFLKIEGGTIHLKAANGEIARIRVRPPRPYGSRSFFCFSVPDQWLAAARRLARLTIFASARASRSSTL